MGSLSMSRVEWAQGKYCQNCPHTMWDHLMAHVSEHCRGKEMDGAVEYDCPCQGYLKKEVT